MRGVVVHAGAATIARKDIDGHERVCRRAAERALAVLARGDGPRAAAVAAVVVLEDDPITNAGTGSVLNDEGTVELDALVMVGRDLALGAVAAVTDVRNPIRLADALVDVADVNVLAGTGASRFASEVGIDRIDPALLVTEARRRGFSDSSDVGRTADTVGAVVVDDEGRTAAAVSTGGVPRKRLGRIGDTPLVGCGAYADDALGAAVTTGVGEGIMRVLLARVALDNLARGLDPKAAAAAAIDLLASRVDGKAGVILVDRAGACGHAFNTPQMSHAFGAHSSKLIVGH